MPRKPKRVDYAPALKPPKGWEPAPLTDDKGEPWLDLKLPETTQRMEEYNKARKQAEARSTLETAVRAAFIAVIAKPLNGQQHAEATQKRLRRAVDHAVHDIVYGLSRATAHPPTWFLLATRPRRKSAAGAPPKIEAAFIAGICEMHYQRITGKPGKLLNSPKPSGHFHDLLQGVFNAFGMDARAETFARRARRVRKSQESP